MSSQESVMQSSVGNEPAQAKKLDDVLPLPKWLVRIYYIFPIILYIPDMLFNFYVYSDGSGTKVDHIGIDTLPSIVLWGFLAVGIVGMAWLLSVLAPWHWIRGNKFQSLMCWGGVFIATAITTWNSLAYRSQSFSSFITDRWINQMFHFNIPGFSPTMVVVAVSPPFWGLFWAIVQPSQKRKSMDEERESHIMKMERLRQETEVKRLKAEANAQIREAQLKGLAATVRSARAQLVSGKSEQEGLATTVTPETPEVVAAERVVALPTGSIRRLNARRTPQQSTDDVSLIDSGEHEIMGPIAASMSYSTAAQPRADVFHASDSYHPAQGVLPLDGHGPNTGEQEILMSTSRAGMPRSSTLLRNYADGEHVMRAVDADVEEMKKRGLKVTIKSFAEYRGIELTLSKQLLAKWKDWKQSQQQAEPPAPLQMAE